MTLNKNNIKIGRLGENLAGKYLISKGFYNLKMNSKIAGVEIDIVCEKDNILYIVEVKSTQYDLSKTNYLAYKPFDRIDNFKINRLYCAAQYLSNEYNKNTKCMALSVIIDSKKKCSKIETLEL